MQHVITAGLVLQTGGTLMSRPVEQVHCSHYSFAVLQLSYFLYSCYMCVNTFILSIQRHYFKNKIHLLYSEYVCLKGVHPYIFNDLKCHKETYGDFQYSYNLKYSFPMLYDCVNVHGWANYIITILLYMSTSLTNWNKFYFSNYRLLQYIENWWL